MKKKLKSTRLIKNSKGQGVMEYMIITSLIGIACLGVINDFGKFIGKKIKKSRTEINRVINI